MSRACYSLVKHVCSNVLFLICGYNQEQLDYKRLSVYGVHFPAGTSTKNIVHFAQGVTSRRFQKYDYGRKNMQIYGSKQPPEYNLTSITNEHIALMSSYNDWLADPMDVQVLRRKLSVKPIMDYTVELEKWNHLDFVLAKESGKYINTKILKLLNEYA